MNVLDLFSGIGGFSLGLERAGFKTVAFCECEPFCQKVLRKHWPDVPIYDDVRELTGERLQADGIGRIDVICGGFPCQDVSSAGRQEGIVGARSGLWGDQCRLIGDIRPRYALIENVTGLLVGGHGAWFERVLCDLAAVGFDAEWECLPASIVGAPHARDRCWIVAYPSEFAMEERQVVGQGKIYGQVLRELRRVGRQARTGWTKNQPAMVGVAHGISGFVDRTRALGNAVVPQIPEMIGRAIMAAEQEREAA